MIGSFVRPKRPVSSVANAVYHAAPAVNRPNQPPTLVVPMLPVPEAPRPANEARDRQ